MKTLNITQNSPAWHAARAQHFCASEAPAMLGVSKFASRSELLLEKHTGIAPEVDPAKQRLFDAGHQAEADARPIAEGIVGQELYPTVGVRIVDGLPMLASLDGCVMDETIIWENKLWSSPLAQACDAGDLEPHYWAQLEHQLIVSEAEKVLFTTSDGSTAKTSSTWYFSVPERREQIIAGWHQFAADLSNYTPTEATVKPIGRTPETLPALHIEVTGMVTASNLAEFKAHALTVFGGINRELVTDQDFASAESTVKWCADIERRLDAAKQHALSQTASIDELFRTMDDIGTEARAVRLELDKLVKARKDTIRAEIVADGRDAMADHINALNERIGKHLMPSIPVDFAGAIKGKRTLDSMRDAVSTELARAKIEANAVSDRITTNLRVLNESPEHTFLFADIAQLVLKTTEDFGAVMFNRIRSHEDKEAARIEAERQRIITQERMKAEAAAQARADAEIAAATAKARAEAHAQAQAEAASRRASNEAIEKARFEALEQSEIRRLASLNDALIVEAKAPTSPPTLRVGQICERLGFIVNAEFLRHLGFEPAATDKAARLYHEHDFPRMCAAMVRHIQQVSQGVAA